MSSSIKGTTWVCLCWLKNYDFLEIVSDFVSFINWLVPNYFSKTLLQQYFSKKFVVYSSLYLFALIENFWNFSIKFLEHTRISISISLLLIFRFSFPASVWDHSFSLIGWDYLQIWIRFIIFPILFPFKKQFDEFKDVDQVCCDGCNVWVHAECENISNKLFKVCLIHLIYELWCQFLFLSYMCLFTDLCMV